MYKIAAEKQKESRLLRDVPPPPAQNSGSTFDWKKMQDGGTAWTGSKGDGGNTSGWGGKTGGGGGQSGGGSPSDKGPGTGQGAGVAQGAGVGQGSSQQLPPPQGQPLLAVDIHRALLVLISDRGSECS